MTHLVRPAGPDDLTALPALEEAADEVFAAHGIGPLPPGAAGVEELGRAAHLLVAGDPVVGFARLDVVDGAAHLEQLSVLPTAARREVGGALVEAAAAWAARAGHESLTLCTFADVPWNGPFYARRGFVAVTDPGPGLRALRATERRLGLDGVGRRVVMRRGVGPWSALGDLASGLAAALGTHLLGLWAHGSLVGGDFDPARSDLDVLAVVARAPDAAVLEAVTPALAVVERRHPAWRGRIEVETVGLPTLRAAAEGVGATEEPADAILRVSPGEALHLLPATPHRVLTWASVRSRSTPLAGPAAADVIPEFPPALPRAALLAHVRDWPVWVEGMQGPGGQAYAVLSICRAWCALVEGEQRSKREAADRFAGSASPDDAGLVRWARDWWYAGGADDEPGRFDAVRDLVGRTSRQLLAREGPTQ
ncbi:GNAT family N-acetyltransferase [Terrabacter sp. NPDC000476]|uniref:GNAT family N-acetyltransferase n=1 Tax=Terrabacter sp. NPDC000476 TaxID=3154258 RepID=UPI00331BFAB5